MRHQYPSEEIYRRAGGVFIHKAHKVYFWAATWAQPEHSADLRLMCTPVRACTISTPSEDKDCREGSFSRSASQLMMVPIVASSMPVRIASTRPAVE